MNSEKDLYRVIEEHGVVKTPLWALGIDYDNDYIEISWCEDKYFNKFHNKEVITYAPRIIINGEVVNFNSNIIYFSMAKQIRMKEIYDEIKKDDSFFQLNEDKKIIKIIKDLFLKVEKGEFIGQSSSYIYVQEIAEILQLSNHYVLKLIEDNMIPKKEIGLRGRILITWKQYESDRIAQLKRTGHKNIQQSDFGWWSCSYCEKYGDEYSNPVDEKCDKITNA